MFSWHVEKYVSRSVSANTQHSCRQLDALGTLAVLVVVYTIVPTHSAWEQSLTRPMVCFLAFPQSNGPRQTTACISVWLAPLLQIEIREAERL
jgi:hypothetical protein